MTTVTPTTTAIYAGVLTLFALVLAGNVIRQRRRSGILLGEAGDSVLQRAVRVQANFTEYVPLALVVMALGEMAGVPAAIVHIEGIALLGGRVLHAWGLGRQAGRSPGRFSGTTLTFAAIACAGCAAIVAGLGGAM